MPQAPEPELPTELTETLAPHLQRALRHPMRRRILRALNGDGEARNLEELALLNPGTSVSTISYHVLVLESCGGISVMTAAPEDGGNRFASNIADDGGVTEFLRLTRENDEIEADEEWS
ncbi:MAG TPA: helix-turn-helix domain-containing protein [Solirubrobacterales bacterium]|nr:helix-turn-helix domain-containing protein [Solirubrobacterales bacterium]